MTDSELHWMRVRDKHQAKMEEWRNRYPKGNMDNMSEELTIAIKETLEKEKLEDEQESKLTKTFEKSDNRNDVKDLDE